MAGQEDIVVGRGGKGETQDEGGGGPVRKRKEGRKLQFRGCIIITTK